MLIVSSCGPDLDVSNRASESSMVVDHTWHVSWRVMCRQTMTASNMRWLRGFRLLLSYTSTWVPAAVVTCTSMCDGRNVDFSKVPVRLSRSLKKTTVPSSVGWSESQDSGGGRARYGSLSLLHIPLSLCRTRSQDASFGQKMICPFRA